MSTVQRYESAKELYTKIGVNTDAALKELKKYPSRCTAGRAMTSRGLKMRAPSQAASRRQATTWERLAHRMS